MRIETPGNNAGNEEPYVLREAQDVAFRYCFGYNRGDERPSGLREAEEIAYRLSGNDAKDILIKVGVIAWRAAKSQVNGLREAQDTVNNTWVKPDFTYVPSVEKIGKPTQDELFDQIALHRWYD